MPTIENMPLEILGVGGIVKFNAACPVLVTLVRDGHSLSMGTVSGKDSFTATVPGSYRFRDTCECGSTYTVMYAGDVGNTGGGSSVSPVLDVNGGIAALTIDGATYPIATPADEDTTYTLTQSGDVLTFTGSDGSSQTITVAHPVDTDTVLGDPLPDAATGIVTWPVLDAVGGSPTGDVRTGDFSGFLSSPHPAIAASGDATATFDAVANEWTIGFVDTDTFATISGSTITAADGSTIDVPAGSTYNASGNTITTSDGQVVQLATDTDTFATFDAATNSLTMADGTVVPLGQPDTNTTYSISNGNLVGSDGSTAALGSSATHTSLNQPNSPIKIVETSAGVFEYDYDTSGVPTTASAPDRNYRQVIEGSDGLEYRLQDAARWRENHDGTITMWQRGTITATGVQDVLLPTAVANNSYTVMINYSGLFPEREIKHTGIRTTTSFQITSDITGGFHYIIEGAKLP